MRFTPLLLCLALPLAARCADPVGLAVYTTHCASCHGAKGEGSKQYKKVLEGDRSPAQLATYIQETMPEDKPGTLSERQAKEVSEYIHDAFYSPIARERNRPARVELSRLTIRQYRNAAADVVNSFRSVPKWGDVRGLRGEYFAARNFRNDKRVADRTDPTVDFDWGTEPAIKDKMESAEFSARWTGSLLATETGEHEILVRTDHGMRLWINDNNKALIDAWVKSGKDTDFKATIFLVAGRITPVRLEFSKSKQGVDDSKKQKAPPPAKPAMMHLMWKTPRGALEPIPARNLGTGFSQELYLCSTAFPPDDRSYGWERGTTVSKEWDAATTEGAIEIANYIMPRIDQLAGTKEGAADRAAKLKAFTATFAERAFRRPLTPDMKKLIVDKAFDGGKNPDDGAKRVLLRVMKSPLFLYREVGAAPDLYDVASRLSFGLWDSIPDAAMLQAAAKGELKTREQIVKQAERMMDDPRAKAKLLGFLMTWLRADQVADLAKDAKVYPGFDPSVIADLRTSLELFLDEVVWSNDSDYRRLLLSKDLYVNERLAKFYNLEEPEEGGFEKTQLDPDRRAGVLTHPYVLATFSHASESSPIHRGVFLARGLLGIALKPPPEAIAPLAPDLHPNMTIRERVSMQTKPATCMGCHGIINPLGFTLEHFDAVGRYREKDHDKAVDTTGAYLTRDGRKVTIKNARELGEFLANSPETHTAFAEQLFHYLVQQPVRAYGPDTREKLTKYLEGNGYNIRKLAVEALVVSALKPRESQAAK